MRFDMPTGPSEVSIRQVIVAGWTGRDLDAVQHHIDELAAIGVAPPSQVPLYYRVAANLLVGGGEIQVLGPDTSGEIEPLIVQHGGARFLGLASDHTDRALETISVAASKQICAKPVAAEVWPWSDVEGHLDQLILLTEIYEKGEWVTYQEGTVAAIRPLPELVADAELGHEAAMLCGTLPAIGGVRPASAYRMSLRDPLLGREITLAYQVTNLPAIE